MNTTNFLADPRTYFKRAYDQFALFGGPCVYFHNECLRAGREAFLSTRHIEMLYATLTAWGMHRMGDETTKARLTEWKTFHDSFVDQAEMLRVFSSLDFLSMSEAAYSDAVLRLRPCYEHLRLSISAATVVVNSKAFHHLFPAFIPPIDRHHSVFYLDTRAVAGQSGQVQDGPTPSNTRRQFFLFHRTCIQIKQLADAVDPELFKLEHRVNGVTAPKAMDNAIMNYVRITSRSLRLASRGAASST